jgi:eukaryotic-like serine/threonine-protein kinase
MANKESNVEAIFFSAIEIKSPEDLTAYLNQACGEDESLRQRVEALLNARPKLGSFLQGQAAEMVITSVPLPLETPGTQIGPYKLLQQIGEGGMGVVWMAEQLEPVCRRVALKVIKPGMDSRQVIARFESERQALAMMDHPSIAKSLRCWHD